MGHSPRCSRSRIPLGRISVLSSYSVTLKAKSFKDSSSQYFSFIFSICSQAHLLPSDWERHKVLFLLSQQSPVQLLLQVRSSRCPRIRWTLGPLPSVYQSLPSNARPSPSPLVPSKWKGIGNIWCVQIVCNKSVAVVSERGEQESICQDGHSHHVTYIQFDFITVTKAK